MSIQRKTLNNTILTEPFATHSVQEKINKGFATVSQKSEFTPLKVLIGDGETVQAGDTVYVRGELSKTPVARDVYEVYGEKHMILPLNHVVFVVRKED